MNRKKTSGGIFNIPKMIPTQKLVQEASKFATIGNTQNMVQAAQNLKPTQNLVQTALNLKPTQNMVQTALNLQPTQNMVQAAQKLVPKTNWRSQAAILAEKKLGKQGSEYYRSKAKTAGKYSFFDPEYYKKQAKWAEYKKQAKWAEGVEKEAARKARKERGLLAYVDDAKKAKKDLNTYLEDSKKGINTYLGSKDFDRKRFTPIDDSNGRWFTVDPYAEYNPLYDAAKALEKATYVEGYVKYINIIYAFSVLLKWISMITYNVISFVTRFIYGLITFILSTLFAWSPWIFLALLFLFCCEYAWIGVVIAINGLIDGWNGAIGVWNTIVERLSDLSIYVPINMDLGDVIGNVDLSFTIPIPGIPLPKGNTEGYIDKDFWQTLHEIVDAAIFNPMNKALKGIVYRI